MKKFIVIVLVFAMLCAMLVGCGNKDVFDTEFTFDRAIIKMPDDSVLEVRIDTWRTYEGEQIQIRSKDGTLYLTSSFNCIMIKD